MKLVLSEVSNMKKLFILFLCFSLLFCSCVNKGMFNVGNPMSKIDKQYTPYGDWNFLRAYEINKEHVIVVHDYKNIKKTVTFSSDRKCILNEDVALINNFSINFFFNMKFDEVKLSIGQPHVDIGSGSYRPSYITEDAYLISFGVNHNVISSVFKYDLLTGDIIDLCY